MIKLTPRLQAIANEIEPCNCFADVGCDHGYISLYVLDRWKANRVVAIDVSLKCLEKTIRLLKSANIDDQAIFYNCNGLSRVREKPDEVLIAGMGGDEIIKILYDYSRVRPLNTIENLILQPMKDIYAVRKWLNENGFAIVTDKVVKDKKLYHILRAKPAIQRLTEEQLMFGAAIQSYFCKEYLEWLREYEQKYIKILKTANKQLAVTESVKFTLNRIRNQIKLVEEEIC